MKGLRRIIFLLLAALLALPALLLASRPDNDAARRRAKARNYFVRGTLKEAEGKIDAAYEYYRKAIKEDPSYIDAGFSYGMTRMMLLDDVFSAPSEMQRNLAYMRPLLEEYPSDVISGETYAYYASLADTLPESIRIYDILVREHPGLSRLYFPRAYYYAQMGRMDSAVLAIREFERLEGASSETTIRKVSFILAEGDTLRALREAGSYAAANPGKPSPILDKAMVYKALNRPDSAIFFLEEGLKEFPNNGDMKFDLALMYVEQGDTANFHRYVADAFKTGDFEYEEKMEMLNIYLRNIPFNADKKKYAESDALFKYAYGQYPKDAAFLDTYSRYEMVKGDFDAALNRVEKAYELDPEDPVLLGRLISFSVLANRPEVGMKAYEEYGDQDEKLEINLGLTYATAAETAKEYDKAVVVLDSMARRVSPSVSLLVPLDSLEADSLRGALNSYELTTLTSLYEVAGDLFSKAKDFEKAMIGYENSLLIDPDNASSLNNYAYFLIDKVKVAPGSEQFARAKEMSRKSIEATADSPQGTYYDTFAWILFREGNYADALVYQEEAMDLEKENLAAEMLSHYGDILFMNGREEEAVEQWKKALEQTPDDTLLKKKIENRKYLDE